MNRHDLADVMRALLDGPTVCRYHGANFGFLGYDGRVPRCESCARAWRVVQALAAVTRAQAQAAVAEQL